FLPITTSAVRFAHGDEASRSAQELQIGLVVLIHGRPRGLARSDGPALGRVGPIGPGEQVADLSLLQCASPLQVLRPALPLARGRHGPASMPCVIARRHSLAIPGPGLRSPKFAIGIIVRRGYRSADRASCPRQGRALSEAVWGTFWPRIGRLAASSGGGAQGRR